MNKEKARARIEAAEKELAAARKALEEAEKPLTWPELPAGAFFAFRPGSDFLGENEPIAMVALENGIRRRVWINTYSRWQNGCIHDDARSTPVTRVNLDGTPYIGDPRK